MNLESVFEVDLPPSPYPGLRPFERREWPIYFGRELMSDEVIARLIDKHLIVIHGDSGSGKSSLVRAALLPRLEQESARGGVCWRTCIALPGEAPMWNLANALASVASNEERDSALAIRRALNFGKHAPDAIAELLQCGPTTHVCILIDQFEELFSHARRHGPDEAKLLTEFLIALHETPRLGLYVALTMRSEFLGACARYPGFAELTNETQYLLPRMGTNDLRRAICEPACLYGGSVTRELCDRLIAETGTGQDQLPLIQHGLMLMYRKRKSAAPGWILGLEDYRDSGGLGKLLSKHADDVLTDSGADPAVAGKLFRELTEINADGQAVRRPRTLARLIKTTGADESALRTVIDAFRAEGASLLRPYAPEPLTLDSPIDVSHEALIRCWRKLANKKDGWLACEFQDGLIWRALLVQSSGYERNNSDLLGPSAVDERAAWFENHTPDWAERYDGGWKRVKALIEASLRDRDRKAAEQEERRRREHENERKALRQKNFAISSAVLALFAIIIAIGAFERMAANRRLEQATNQVKQTEQQLQQVSSQAYSANFQAEETNLRSQWATADREQQDAERADAIRNAAKQLATTSGGSATSVRNVAKALQQEAQNLTDPTAVSLKTRVYIQIANETQHPAALALQTELRSQAQTGLQLTVPPIQRVTYTTRQAELRCFRAEECEGDGNRIVQALNTLLRSPRVTLSNLSERYARATNVRPRHFELWFSSTDTIILNQALAGKYPAVNQANGSATVTLQTSAGFTTTMVTEDAGFPSVLVAAIINR